MCAGNDMCIIRGGGEFSTKKRSASFFPSQWRLFSFMLFATFVLYIDFSEFKVYLNFTKNIV